jgi:hypothetical protein
MKTATRCPDWCAGGHHCTASLAKGSHTSVPEVWRTDVGRVVATRHQHTRGGHLELTIVVKLPEQEGAAVPFMRHLIAAAYYLINRVAVDKTFSDAFRGKVH